MFCMSVKWPLACNSLQGWATKPIRLSGVETRSGQSLQRLHVGASQTQKRPGSRGLLPRGRISVWRGWLTALRALIEKSMSIWASSSPGRLPARLKSPNEAWSRYLIPHSLCQSDFVAEVIPLVFFSPPFLLLVSDVFMTVEWCDADCFDVDFKMEHILHHYAADMSRCEHQSAQTTDSKA